MLDTLISSGTVNGRRFGGTIWSDPILRGLNDQGPGAARPSASASGSGPDAGQPELRSSGFASVAWISSPTANHAIYPNTSPAR